MKHLIIPVIIILVLLGACKKNSDSAVPVTQSSFMFFNAVPNSDKFNVMLDTVSFASNVEYGTNTGYKTFLAQKYNLIITAASQPSVVLFNREIFLRNNRFYAAYLGTDSTKTALVLITTEDDLSPAGNGLAKFRVIDFSEGFKPNRTPLGIDIYSDTSRTATLLFKALTFPALSAYGALYGDSSYMLDFRWVDSSKSLKPLSLHTQPGKVYTFITTGYPLDTARFNIFAIQHN